MNTETTELIRGWIFYDAQCPFCTGWVNRAHGSMLHRRFHLVPLQARWARVRLGLDDKTSLGEMKLLLANGCVFGGADALIQIARSIWWAWPVFALTTIPGIKPVLRTVYRRVARDRYCLGGRCRIPNVSIKHHRHLTSAFYEIP